MMMMTVTQMCELLTLYSCQEFYAAGVRK